MYNLNSDPKCFIQCFGSVSGSASFCQVRICMKIFARISKKKCGSERLVLFFRNRKYHTPYAFDLHMKQIHRYWMRMQSGGS